MRHYGFGLVLALLLGYAVFSVRAQSERRLRTASADLDAVAVVARCGHTGTDPRPVTVAAVNRLSGAVATSWVEVRGDHLLAFACAGVDIEGLTVPRDEARIISTCFRDGERVLVADGPNDDVVNAQLLAITGTTSLLFEPVVHGGEVLAVLVVGWDRMINHLDDHALAVTQTLAAEAGASLAATRLRAALVDLATTDTTTGIANRRGWNQSLERLTATARRDGAPLTLALGDLDHFKVYNDTHGHDAGDEQARGSPTPPGRCCARSTS
ncbi:hypothetical protein GCM10025868_27740 [Angustibacter aerolatus]|uniref:GGDEF domain-containing protein n=1 Tax=Angustibacter aerolatus TaxID=1162965 RepID=A0ABQ6JI58_9ACTN|nr:hypothetical protein GCM10025868_27740 [Angustibacter aerolatus]